MTTHKSVALSWSEYVKHCYLYGQKPPSLSLVNIAFMVNGMKLIPRSKHAIEGCLYGVAPSELLNRSSKSILFH